MFCKKKDLIVENYAAIIGFNCKSINFATLQWQHKFQCCHLFLVSAVADDLLQYLLPDFDIYFVWNTTRLSKKLIK